MNVKCLKSNDVKESVPILVANVYIFCWAHSGNNNQQPVFPVASVGW